MLSSRALNRTGGLLILLLGLVVFVTSLRAAALLWQVREENRMTAVELPDKPALPVPRSGEPASADAPVKPAAAVPGLPGLIKADAVFYLLIPDYPRLSAAIAGLDYPRLWQAGGLAQAGAPLTAAGEGMWGAFSERYAFSLDALFAGMGPAAGRVEVIISDFTVFRGVYSLRLTAACRLKNNADEAFARFQRNAAKRMATRRIQDILVYEKKGSDGVLSVFRHEDMLYITAGANTCEELIAALKGKRPPAVFADDPALKQQFARQAPGPNSLFVFAGDKLIDELTGRAPGKPAGLRVRIEQGEADEELDVPLSAGRYIRPGTYLADVPVPERCILALNARPTQAGIEETAGLAARMVGWNNPIRISKNNEGCFWDLMYSLNDYCDGNTAAFLNWDENSILLTWYFVSRIRKPEAFDAWMDKVSAGREMGTVIRDDGQSIKIVPCRRQLLDFASFCYVRRGDRLYYSYSSQILKSIPLEGTAPSYSAGEGDALFRADLGELADFITNRKLTKLLRDFELFETSRLTDLPALGKALGQIHGSIQLNGDRTLVRLRSAAGLTGLPAAIHIIESRCNLNKE